MELENSYRFQVNLGGMIEILSDHLYSSPNVYIRELLQNGVDAIAARRKKEPDGWEAKLTLEVVEGKKLEFTDNGQGLTQEEIHRFLAIIGESSKRDLATGRIEEDYIGRFGIGLLSCFMVSEEICMVTRSMEKKEDKILCWTGHPDGTYEVEEVRSEGRYADMEIGTKVILRAKKGMEEYFAHDRIEYLIKYYGMLLPVPVELQKEQINPVYLPWEGRETNSREIMLFGNMMFGEQFFDYRLLHDVNGEVIGVAYITPYTMVANAQSNQHRIYLKHMLLTQNGMDLLPKWAGFVRCILNVKDLRPTASREGFYVDALLVETQKAIEQDLLEFIEELATRDVYKFQQFLSIHQVSLREAALVSDHVFEELIQYIEFETTRGILNGKELSLLQEPFVYAPTKTRYKQLSQLFFAKNQLLIDVSIIYSRQLLQRLGEMLHIPVEPVGEWNVEELMQDLDVNDQDDVIEFETIANGILAEYDCEVVVRSFAPGNQPTFYMINETTYIRREIEESKEAGDDLFAGMLCTFKEELKQERGARLYFNFRNPIVRKLLQIQEKDMLKVMIKILYVQALQVGGFALRNNELGILNQNIMTLMDWSMS